MSGLAWIRFFFFVVAVFECWACGVNSGLHYWEDAACEALGAAFFFAGFFALPWFEEMVVGGVEQQ